MTTFLFDLRAAAIVSCVWLAAAAFSGAAEPEKQGAAEVANESTMSLDGQLAKARLQLAEAELNRALAANKRMPIFRPVTMQLLRGNVDIAAARLEALSESREPDLHAAHLRELENHLKVAELNWNSAVRVRERSPGSIDAAQVETLRLRVEVARLVLACAREPSNVVTPIVHMQWELEQLRQEVLELTLRVDELSNKR